MGMEMGPEWDFWDEKGEGRCPCGGHGVYDVSGATKSRLMSLS